ncbi:NAD-dependent epimerase/dehydratase family protein [Nocardia sp. 2]|uniref:NAD-dependent epimerase/dehydratase family protein n=1 Tax=Nocardia acididurans TaxID=2802282 RepID=A0ABS1M7V4_9NOCA|nr:NAD-dependent epimerase/dehydratase family protein [Nocardia acididurans]MBL1076732.1 NAD-dependent epimerase/dehydratase family protein [Nocardia acididurans]
MSNRVLVTGVSGYLAGHIVTDLRERGYEVRGTVRSLAKTAATAHLTGVELVEADLSSDAGWAEAVAGCRYVVHAASPFPAAEPKREDELVRPAVDGTLRVLRAAAAGGVERVVLTSSIAAVRMGHDHRCTEDDWSVLDACDPYPKSKTLAERAAWDFAAEHPETELAVINPGMILGPVQRAGVGTSVDAIRALMAREIPAVPRIGFCPVDVRDVATAHRLALETPAAAGNRYIVAGEFLPLPDMARILATRYRVPTRVLPDVLVRLGARFDPTARTAARFLGHEEHVSSDKARRDLGWTMRPVEDTLFDTAAGLIDFGVVTDPGRPRGHARSAASGARTATAG